ncbi:3'-5' exonuclease [Pelistega europaea]|uniref:3'-5' exonuclease n=1 Tax=Pelistega europaea TaxID=106147 RepID=UPI001C11CC57|nr:3'-5' exonuclease [Pelistega europaea]
MATQSIYDGSVGDLSQYGLVKIIKKQNRRNPKAIIELANKFRNDIQQMPSEDVNAPNMESGVIREGTIKFLYGKELHSFTDIRRKSLFKAWDFSDGTQTKELRLTHKYNAEMSEFEDLYDLYHDDLIVKLIKKINDKVDSENLDKDETLGNLVARIEPTFKKQKLLDLVDDSRVHKLLYNDLKDMPWEEVFKKCRIAEQSLMSYKLNGLSRKYEANSSRDRILRRLDILAELIELYESNKVNDFLRITKFSIDSTNDKIHLKETMDYLLNEEDKTIGDVLLFAEKKGLLKNDELYSSYILNGGYYLWKRIQEIPFKQYRKSIAYLKEFSPICTQHSVKGSEYDNVLLILESNWNKYDFNTLFGHGSSSTSVQQRTKNLFYVCITRAKKNLVIYMPTDELEIVNKAKNIFGEENVMHMSSI